MRPAIRLACLSVAIALSGASSGAFAAKATECTKVGICYCVNDELKAGKAVGYLSVPLTSGGGGNFNVNKEVADSARAALEKRFGSEFVYVLNPATLEADLPKGTGPDYMLMWTTLLEGPDGTGDFDFVYFAGPQDFARYFGFDGTNDMGKLDAYFDKRVASDADFAKAVQGGLTKANFRKYYALRASSAVSRGAHDEWNIFRMINEKRRSDSKFGTPSQIPVLFDGQAVAPPQGESSVSEGYVGK